MADSNLVKFGSYDIEAAQAEGVGIGGAFFTPPVGRSIVRVIPPPVGVKSPYLVTYQHYIETPATDSAIKFNCPEVTRKDFCPACERYRALTKSGNPADSKAAESWKAKRRVYVNILDRANPDKGPQVWAFGVMIHRRLIDLREDNVQGVDYTHPVTGYDIVLKKEGSGRDTRYYADLARNASKLAPDAESMNDLIDMQIDLAPFAKMLSDDEMIDALGGLIGSHKAAATQSRARSAQDDIDAAYTENVGPDKTR